jgi:hypothetical protein
MAKAAAKPLVVEVICESCGARRMVADEATPPAACAAACNQAFRVIAHTTPDVDAAPATDA